MTKLKEHVKKHAQKVAQAGRHAHRKLQTPVHPVIGWWTISAVAMSCFLIVGQAFAQTSDILPPPADPAAQQTLSPDSQSQPPQDGQSRQPNQQPQPPAPCEPGKPCQPPPPPNSGGNQGDQPGGQNQPGNQQGNQPGGFNNQNQGQPGNPGPNQGQMGGPNQGQNQQMDEQRFEMMKNNLKQFTREVSRVKSQIKSLQKKGINIPVELSGAIAQMDAIAEKVKSAKNGDDIESDMNDFQDAANTLQEWMPKLGMMAQMPQMFKQADREITKVEKAYTSDAKRIKSSKMDLNDLLAEFRKAIDEQKAVLDKAKELSNSDPQEAMNTMQDDFFGNMDNMWEKDRVIQMALNIKLGISQMAREMKDADKLIKTLKAKKLDTAELQELLAQAKLELEQVKALAAAKPIDPESLMSQIETLMNIKQDFGDKVQELTGDTGYAPPPQPQAQNFQFNMPSGFSNQGSGGGQGGGFGQQPNQMMPQQGQGQPR